MNFSAEIERAAHLLGLHLARATEDLGLTQAEAHVLSRLGRGEAASVNELHRLFGHRRSTLTGVLDRLEARGLVRREVNPADRRSFLVTPTPEGRTAAATVTKAVSKLEQAITARTNGVERQGFGAVLAAIEAVART